jgi:hypothetical protein
VRANKGKKTIKAADEPKELSFMRPIEPKADEDADEPKLSRAERRAAKPQVKQHGTVNNMRNQSVPNHRNFSTRRSG